MEYRGLASESDIIQIQIDVDAITMLLTHGFVRNIYPTI